MKAKRPQTPKRTARAKATPASTATPRPRASTKPRAASTTSARPSRPTVPKRTADTAPAQKKRTASGGSEAREASAPSGPVIEQILELEAQLDRLLDHASQHPPAAKTIDVDAYEADLELT